MTSEIEQGNIEQMVQECESGTEVVILHLRENCPWQACIVLRTEPFCNPMAKLVGHKLRVTDMTYP